MASEPYKKCERILQLLKKHTSAESFQLPAERLANVKEPLDLNTVEKKLKAGEYSSTGLLALDIRKIWNNSWSHSEPGTTVFISTTEISNYFEKLWKEVGLGDVPFGGEESSEIQELKKQVSKVTGAIRRMAAGAPQKPTGGHSSKGQMDKQMTIPEKTQLKQRIMKLPQDKLSGVIQIIKDAIDTTNSRDTLEFDLDSLPTRTCRELEQYVKRSLPQKHGKKKSPQVSESKRPPPPSKIETVLAFHISLASTRLQAPSDGAALC